MARSSSRFKLRVVLVVAMLPLAGMLYLVGLAGAAIGLIILGGIAELGFWIGALGTDWGALRRSNDNGS